MKLSFGNFLSVLLIILPSFAYAQKTKNISGEYTYYVPSNISKEEAIKIAIDRARIAAIAADDDFGTIVSQHNTTLLSNKNEKSDESFVLLGGSDVRGEWLEDTKVPKLEFGIDPTTGDTYIKVRVFGKVRKIVRAENSFIAKVLRNGVEEKYEDAEFRNGDDMFLQFISSIDGYLSIYYMDALKNVYCLLPYSSNSGNSVKIKHDTKYTFFSKKTPNEFDEFPELIDEYNLTCEMEREDNFIYILFSQNEFNKAITNTNAATNLRQMSFENFQRYLAKNRNFDKKFQEATIAISVSK